MRDYRALSVIIAAFNEAGSIEKVVRRVSGAVPGAEVLVVDGGSDGTSSIVERLTSEFPRLRLVRNPNDRGKGHAIRVGVEHATGDVHAQIDADLQFLPEELPLLVDPILDGEVDVTLGSRFMRGSIRRAGATSTLSVVGNAIANLYTSVLCGQRVTDSQAGMKAWSQRAIARIALKSDNFSYEAEIVVNGIRRGLRVRDVPITTVARDAGMSKVNYLRDGLRLARDVTRFRLGA